MRRIALLAIVIGLGLCAMFFIPFKQTISLPSTVEEVIKVEVKSELTTRVEDAQKEAEGDIEAKAKKAYDDARNQAMKQIELDVTTAYRKEVEKLETDLEKEVGVY